MQTLSTKDNYLDDLNSRVVSLLRSLNVKVKPYNPNTKEKEHYYNNMMSFIKENIDPKDILTFKEAPNYFVFKGNYFFGNQLTEVSPFLDFFKVLEYPLENQDYISTDFVEAIYPPLTSSYSQYYYNCLENGLDDSDIAITPFVKKEVFNFIKSTFDKWSLKAVLWLLYCTKELPTGFILQASDIYYALLKKLPVKTTEYLNVKTDSETEMDQELLEEINYLLVPYIYKELLQFKHFEKEISFIDLNMDLSTTDIKRVVEDVLDSLTSFRNANLILTDCEEYLLKNKPYSDANKKKSLHRKELVKYLTNLFKTIDI